MTPLIHIQMALDPQLVARAAQDVAQAVALVKELIEIEKRIEHYKDVAGLANLLGEFKGQAGLYVELAQELKSAAGNFHYLGSPGKFVEYMQSLRGRLLRRSASPGTLQIEYPCCSPTDAKADEDIPL